MRPSIQVYVVLQRYCGGYKNVMGKLEPKMPNGLTIKKDK
jgi:hypothetical protein